MDQTNGTTQLNAPNMADIAVEKSVIHHRNTLTQDNVTPLVMPASSTSGHFECTQKYRVPTADTAYTSLFSLQ